MDPRHTILLSHESGSYSMACYRCGADYYGAKHSMTCLPCASEQANIILSEIEQFPAHLRKMWSGGEVLDWIKARLRRAPLDTEGT